MECKRSPVLSAIAKTNSFATIAIMGLLPFTNTTFGLMPIFGYNVLLNALTAFAAAYYGLIIPAKVMGTNVSPNL